MLFWILLTALVIVSGFSVTLLTRGGRHASSDLGSVSTPWVAQHRADRL